MYKLFLSAFLLGFLLFSEADAFVQNFGTWSNSLNSKVYVGLHYAGTWVITFSGNTTYNSDLNWQWLWGWVSSVFPWVWATYPYWTQLTGWFDINWGSYQWFWSGGIFYRVGGLQYLIEEEYFNNGYVLNNRVYIDNISYFCLYRSAGGGDVFWYRYLNSDSCPDTQTWYATFYKLYIANSGTPPTSGGTLSTTVNGLNCSTKLAPDIDNASWYYPWRYDYFYNQSSTGSLRYVFSQSDVNRDNIDIVQYSLINDGGSEIPQNSINWTNTGANAFLIGNWELLIQGIENRNFRSFNLVQIGGVALPSGTTLPIRYESLNWNLHDGLSIMSGSILTIGFNELVKKVWISNIWRFNGIRLWVAPEKSVTFCGVANASCGYKFIGTGLQCTPLRVYTTLSQGSCVIAGSGSLYGSGSCVPAVNASGAIIPFIQSQNNTIQYDQNGNIVGAIQNPIPDTTYFDNVFSCWFLEDDSWYVTIGKSLICPITVTKNIVFNAWENVNDAVNGLQPLQNSITNLDTLTWSTIGTWVTTNGFTDAFSDRLDGIGNGNTWFDRMFNFVWYGMILTVIIFIIGILIFLIRKNK